MRSFVLLSIGTALFVLAGSVPLSRAAANDAATCSAAYSKDAIAACTRIIENNETSLKDRIAAYYDRGLWYRTAGDVDRAIADFSEVIRLDPKFALGYTQRGAAYGHKGDFDSGIADDTAAIRLNPEDATAYYNRAVDYQRKGDLDRAIPDYDEAIRLNPRYGQAYYNRGKAKRAKGDLAGGETDIARAKDLGFDGRDAH